MVIDREIEVLNLSDGKTAAQVLDVQRAAYRIEAGLIGFDGIPPLHESLDALVAQPLIWIGIRQGGQVTAAFAYRLDNELCDIDRLVVAPEHFGKGLASTLVGSLLHHLRITVSTGTRNTPARRLYEKLGFQRTGERQIPPGVTVTHYERRG